jgi:transcriptional regulator with GAF, ATPase, and Fis domain
VCPHYPFYGTGQTFRNMAMSVVSELERLASAIAENETSAEKISMPALAEKIAKELHVKVDEVAILAVSNRWRHLHFLVPAALKNVGFVPLTSNSALAARTARDNKPEINNNFSGTRHATVFEGVKAATTTGESIQKIISAPILHDGKVVGVMQISRKGDTTTAAGPDFTSEDLRRVVAICGPLGKLVNQLSGE